LALAVSNIFVVAFQGKLEKCPCSLEGKGKEGREKTLTFILEYAVNSWIFVGAGLAEIFVKKR
jgi:hypothetical protein